MCNKQLEIGTLHCAQILVRVDLKVATMLPVIPGNGDNWAVTNGRKCTQRAPSSNKKVVPLDCCFMANVNSGAVY